MNALIRLPTRFNYNTARVAGGIGLMGTHDEGFTEDQLRQAVPSIFAEAPHASRSARYGYVPTIDVVRGLAKEGFRPVFAVEAGARDVSKHGYTKHMLRFRTDRHTTKDGEHAEVVMVNSHDGSTSYQLFGGIFRRICANGLIYGEGFDEVRIQHKANVVNSVIEGTFSVVDSFDRALGSMDEMKAITLHRDEAELFAQAAHQLRFDEESNLAEAIEPTALLAPRRFEDRKPDLWTMFNRVQENVIRGGIHGVHRNDNGQRRRVTSREVNGIDQTTKLNRALWTLAEGMARLKSAAVAA